MQSQAKKHLDSQKLKEIGPLPKNIQEYSHRGGVFDPSIVEAEAVGSL